MVIAALSGWTRDQKHVVLASFLGWALDALDFFLVTFVLTQISQDFGRSISQVAFSITLTLMMRPLGAFIFGLLGDNMFEPTRFALGWFDTAACLGIMETAIV